MNIKNINTTEINETFGVLLNSLSEKEKNVLSRRIGLNGVKETLQGIGDSFSSHITRERVRQIEDSGIKKLGRIIKNTNLTKIQEHSLKILDIHGGVLVKDKIINSIIKDLQLDENINKSIVDAIITSDYYINKSKPRIGTNTYFYLPKVNNKIIDSIHKEALIFFKKRKDIVTIDNLCEQIRFNLKQNFSNIFIISSLEIFEDIVFGEGNMVGLTKWKILNPKTLKDKAIYILRKEKIPMHFIEISNKISEWVGEKIKVNTVHNELIRNNEFVLVGRGIYALKDWGIYKPGNIIDVIKDILKKAQSPLSTEEIISKVLKVRQVKTTTIYMNLQNKNFIQRVGRNFYKLKEE